MGGGQGKCDREVKFFDNSERKKNFFWGEGFGGQARCVQRSEVFVKIQKIIVFLFFFFFLGGGVSGRGSRVQGGGWGSGWM